MWEREEIQEMLRKDMKAGRRGIRPVQESGVDGFFILMDGPDA